MNARWLAALTVATGLIVTAIPEPGAAEGLGAFSGSWSGGGTITVSNGSRERIRCRSTNRSEGRNLSLSLRCASDSYKFELASDLKSEGNNISGSWNETTRGVFGQLDGRISGGRIQATASAVGFTATLLISSSGSALSVSIRSPGSEISEVSISMSRVGGRA
jgi:hypothetical protein